MNAWDEDEDTLAAYANSEKLKQQILLEGSEVARRYGLGMNVPVVLWVDRNGVVVETEWGFGGADSLKVKTRRLVAAGR